MKKLLLSINLLLLFSMSLYAEKLYCIPMGLKSHTTKNFVKSTEQEAVNGSFILHTSNDTLKIEKRFENHVTVFKYRKTYNNTRVYYSEDNLATYIISTGKQRPKVIHHIELYLDNQPQVLISACSTDSF